MWQRVGIAALQGALLWALYAALDAGRWPATAPGPYVALVTVIVLVPLLYYLVSGLDAPRSRVGAVLAVASIVLLGVGLHHGGFVTGPFVNRSEGGGQAPTGYALVVAVLCIHALPFAQAFLVNGDWRVRYPDLFRFAWRNALLIALGVLFCGVFWLLLGLWAQLFRMLGIGLFVEVFFDARFAIPATTVAAGVGIQLAGSVERLETALREQILALLKWLAPLAALILGLFSVALLVKTPELLAAKQRTISASWLLWLVAMNVLLLNAAYQDGEAAQPYPRWLARAMRWVVPLLLVVASIAAYAIAVRIDEYGLTTSRVWAALVALIAGVYAAGYAWASFRRGRWMDGMGQVNVLVALLTIAALVLLLTPVLSPFRLAAASQFDRVLASDDAEDVDAFLTLRFDTGVYGRDRLARLAALQVHPRSDEIRRLAAAARAATQRHLARVDVEKVAALDLLLQAYPAGMEITPTLRDAIARVFDEEIGWGRVCNEAAGPCAVLFADLNADGTAEAIVFSVNPGGLILRRIDADWRAAGWLQPGSWTSPEDLTARLQKGDFRVVEPEWSVLMLGDRAFRYRELEPRANRPGVP